MKKLLLSIVSIIIIFSLASCTRSGDRIGGNSQIDWVDFIKINGKTYSSIYTSILSDPAKVRDPIGEVKFQVAGAVGNPDYKIKDGDAAFWPKGTKIYSIEGCTDNSFIAVKDEENIHGYRLYYQNEEKPSYKWHYKDMPKDKVKRIEIYTFKENNKQKLKEQMTDSKQIISFIALLDKGHMVNNTNIDTSTGFNMVFYTDDIYAYKYTLYKGGKAYYWSPWDTMELPEEIDAYFN